MINFRYHVVSLVAVFLALGAGIIVGSNVIDREIVDRLNSDLKDFTRRNAELRGQNDQLSSQLRFWDSFGQALVPQLVRGKLAGKTFTLVVQDGVDGRAVNLLSDTLVQAGAAKPSRLSLTKKWLLTEPAAYQELSVAAGSAIACCEKPALLKDVGARLGTRLGSGGDPRADSDLLKALSDAGFLRLDNVGRGTFPAPGSIIITLALGDTRDSPPVQDLLVPLVEAMSAGRPTVVGEPLGAKDSLTDKVRGNRDLTDRVPTVDHANTAPGRLALVWALRTMLDGGEAAHYGVHRGTDGLTPAVA